MTGELDTRPLSGKVALVTGAGRGQGAEHAVALARAGATIVALDIGADIDGFYPMASQSDLAATIARVESTGAQAISVTADVRDSAAVATAVDAAQVRFGSIDVVCNNAGICRIEAIDEISDGSLDAVIDINLKGLFNVARAVVPIMKAQRGGSIINIASAAAIKVTGYTSVYVASKAAAIAVTKSWAHELAEWNIRVNGIAPGSIHNALTEGIVAQRGLDMDEARASWRDQQLLQDVSVTAADIADMVIYLATARVVTGQTYAVDAGWSIR
jgi:NAD(P)-dependent dehydrogenase (short-subunit alcohol dehydrogenase family)